MNPRKVRPPSPHVRISLSADRASILKSKPKFESISDKLVPKLQSPEKAPTNTSNLTLPSVLSNKSLSRYWCPQENGNVKADLPELDEQQELKAEKDRSRIKAMHQKPDGIQTNMDMRIKAGARKISSDSSETENKEFVVVDSISNGNSKVKKFQRPSTRISQNIERRYAGHFSLNGIAFDFFHQSNVLVLI